MHIAQVYFKDLSYDPPQYLHYSNTFVTVLFLYFWQTSVSPYYSFRSPSKSLSISDSLFFFHSLSPVPFFLQLSPLPFFLYLSPLSLFLSLSLPLYLSLPPSLPNAPHSFLILLSPASHFCFSLFRWMFCLRFLHYVECHRQWCFILSLALMCVCARLLALQKFIYLERVHIYNTPVYI